MTKQVKVFLVFLAVLAIVSVFSFFDVFTGVRSARLQDSIAPLLPIEKDHDQDGLPDADESYWGTNFEDSDTDDDGFLDGEEVISGFDPREPIDHPLGDSLASTVYGSPKELASKLEADIERNFGV